MNWLKKLFSKRTTFVGQPIDTAEELFALANKNQIVRAELDEFEKRINDKTCAGNQYQEAFKSAEALSGYGISVSKKAFLETTEYH